jgi:serine/threonine protein kinase
MAEVYRAKDTRLGRDVAIKVMSEALGGDVSLLDRFQREAKLASSMNHPNVVALYDVGFHEDKPYFVTELLQGETLRERLAKGAVPLALALEWAAQMAQGIAAAHERGIAHRDLKPENVFITRDGHLKLLDFGIAKLLVTAQGAAPHGLLGAAFREQYPHRHGARDAGLHVTGTSPGRRSRCSDGLLQPRRGALRDADRPACILSGLGCRERVRHSPHRARGPSDDRPLAGGADCPALPQKGPGATLSVGA